MLKKINVNELADLLKAKEICHIDVASIDNQRNPEFKKVGVAGVLNIYYEEDEDG